MNDLAGGYQAHSQPKASKGKEPTRYRKNLLAAAF